MKKFLAAICAIILLLTGCGVLSEPVLNLGMTFEQFKAEYNATIAENFSETGWDISAATLKTGEDKDFFSYRFSDNVSLMGAADKDSGIMKELVVMLIPQAQNETEKALLAYITLMLMLNPELTVEQRGELIKELKLTGEDVTDLLNQNDGMAVRGKVKYRTTFVKDMGVLQFIASAKDLE